MNVIIVMYDIKIIHFCLLALASILALIDYSLSYILWASISSAFFNKKSAK